MTLRNPNRFVTGLVDAAYVKAVNLKDTSRDNRKVVVVQRSTPKMRVKPFHYAKQQDAFPKDNYGGEEYGQD